MSFPEPFFRWRPHPWHGLSAGPEPPGLVQAYIEITPFDLVKYEVDKSTGYIRVDRPQRGTSQPPTLYGFVPRTYCGPRVRELCPGATAGDHDPLDICVVSERPINRGDIIVDARVLGGLQVLDGGEADDKIIAVLDVDNVWGDAKDISDLPPIMVERLRHYFQTYKYVPGSTERVIEVQGVYGVEHALKVVTAALADYEDAFGG
jgi:inorganic pyrophosphatase